MRNWLVAICLLLSGVAYAITPEQTVMLSGGVRPALSADFLTSQSLPTWLTHSRTSNAIYTDSTGKLQYAPANQFLHSSNLGSSGWTANNVSRSATTTGPDGVANSAQTLTASAGSATHNVQHSTTITSRSNGKYVVSVYVKAGTSNFVFVDVLGTTDKWATAVFDLSGSNTTASQTSAGATSGTVISTSQENVGNSWFRVSIAASNDNTTIQPVIGFASAATGNTFDTSGQVTFNAAGTETLSVFGAQAQPSTHTNTPTPYNTTAASAYYGPRFTYDGNTLASLGLLMEEIRTNIIFASEDFALNWTGNDSPSPTKTNTAPDGTSSAYSWAFNTASTGYNRSITPAASTAYTMSVYVKYVSGTAPTLLFGSNSALWGGGANTNQATVEFNPQTNAFSNVQAGVTSYGSEAVGNNWYRIWVTSTTNSTAGARTFVQYITATGTLTTWGYVVEAGTFKTSYIPTVTATFARSIDLVPLAGQALNIFLTTSASAIVEFGQIPSAFAAYVLAGNVTNALYMRVVSSTSVRNTTAGGNLDATIGYGNLFTGVLPNRACMAFSPRARWIVANNGAVRTDTNPPAAVTAVSLGQNTTGTFTVNSTIRSIALYDKTIPAGLLKVKCVGGVPY